jgi:transcriptional regulator with XRE-family HTH domain
MLGAHRIGMDSALSPIRRKAIMDKPPDMAEAFGAFVKAQRLLANISQRQLAKASGMSDSYLSQIERGQYRPSAEVLRGIAGALHIPPAVLFAQFGLLDTDEEQAPRVSVEEAIRLDDSLTQDKKDALLHMYRTLRDSA